MLPAAMASVHSRYHTPHVAILAYATASCLFAISGTFRPLAVLASISLLLIYLAVCVAALKLRASGPAPAGAFRAPFGPLVPVLGAATVAWLLAHTTRAEALGMAIAVSSAAVYFLLRRQVLRGRAPAEIAQREEGT
jgi:amino acid transporter